MLTGKISKKNYAITKEHNDSRPPSRAVSPESKCGMERAVPCQVSQHWTAYQGLATHNTVKSHADSFMCVPQPHTLPIGKRLFKIGIYKFNNYCWCNKCKLIFAYVKEYLLYIYIWQKSFNCLWQILQVIDSHAFLFQRTLGNAHKLQ